MSGSKTKLLSLVVAGALLLTGLCIVIALSLFQQQSVMTQVLRENVTSRRAAVDLETCLYDISALLQDNVDDVSSLNDRLEQLLDRLREVADQDVELDASRQLDRGLKEYLASWNQLPPVQAPGHEEAVRATLRVLNDQLIEPCQQFRLYNGRRIEQSTMQHENVLSWLAWGMTGIGVIGGISGIVLGVGVTWGLTRSIHRLQVRLLHTAGKLGNDLPEITLTEEGQFSVVHAQLDQLTTGIERVLRDLKQRELEVLRSDQLAAVGHLAASVAHEIRNPLTAIKMLVQNSLEADQGPLSEEDLAVIEKEIRRMESSLRILLDFARPPKLERQPVQIAELIEGVVGLVRGRCDQQGVTIHVRIAENLKDRELLADFEQLRQVVVNLVLNSLDALPRGGDIDIMVTQTETDLSLQITDTGPGVSESMLSRLFQPFSSDKETGLGLGLVISKRIIDDHGGSIHAKNLPEGGASFTVKIPMGT